MAKCSTCGGQCRGDPTDLDYSELICRDCLLDQLQDRIEELVEQHNELLDRPGSRTVRYYSPLEVVDTSYNIKRYQKCS